MACASCSGGSGVGYRLMSSMLVVLMGPFELFSSCQNWWRSSGSIGQVVGWLGDGGGERMWLMYSFGCWRNRCLRFLW